MYRIGVKNKFWTLWDFYVDTREEAVAIRAKGLGVVFKKVHKKGK